MITDESTMMPKSTAPIDSRLADLPRRKSIAKANNSASGMLIATISAVRTLLRNISSTTVTRAMPSQQVLLDRFGGDVDQLACGRSRARSSRPAAVGRALSFSSSTSASTSCSAGSESSPLRNSTIALHHVVVVVPLAVAVARRVISLPASFLRRLD